MKQAPSLLFVLAALLLYLPVAQHASAGATGATHAASATSATARPTPSPTAQAPSPLRASAKPLPLMRRFVPRATDDVKPIRPGVVHVRRSTGDPLKINVLLFDLTAPQLSIRAALGDGWLSGRYQTSELAAQNKALAGVNGDLFASDGVPQGLTIVDGRVAIAPKHRATFAISRSRQPFIGYFTNEWTWQSEVRAADGERAPVTLLNTVCVADAICRYNRFARAVPERAGEVKVVLNDALRVTAIVRESRVRVLTGTEVLAGTGAGARWLLKHVAIGDRLAIAVATNPPLSDYAQAISGGPILLRDGQFVEDCLCTLNDCRNVALAERGPLCEDFSADWKERHYRWVRMPRTGIGYDRQKQTLIVAVVDGYQRGYSRGITQAEFAALLQEFGADTAMEFDGGGSSTMVLKGKVLNRPPDASGERYVANALLFFWDDGRSVYR